MKTAFFKAIIQNYIFDNLLRFFSAEKKACNLFAKEENACMFIFEQSGSHVIYCFLVKKIGFNPQVNQVSTSCRLQVTARTLRGYLRVTKRLFTPER